jgi:hypothetical protein
MGLEGLVSKRADSRYRGGRSPDWVKVKNRQHPAMERVMEALLMVAKDAFDQWWEWAEKPLDSALTIPAEIHEPVMQLASEDRRNREKVNEAVARWQDHE